MRRPVLFLWWGTSLIVWFILGHLLAWAFLRISWDVPLWLQHGAMWTLRKIEQPGYNPMTMTSKARWTCCCLSWPI